MPYFPSSLYFPHGSAAPGPLLPWCVALLLAYPSAQSWAAAASQSNRPELQASAAPSAMPLLRQVPVGFMAAQAEGADHFLKYKNAVYRNIVFVSMAQDDKNEQKKYTLAPVSIKPLQALLLSLGLHEPAVAQWVQKLYWREGDEDCLALQEQPQRCVRLRIAPIASAASTAPVASSEPVTGLSTGARWLELKIDDAQMALRPETVSSDWSLTGASYAYVGAAQNNQTLGFNTWGVVSAGPGRAEYDLGAVQTKFSNQVGLEPSRRLRVNTLIAGAPAGTGMGFAGLFRGASGGQAFGAGGGQGFFSRPLQWGLAWQSDDSRLSDAQIARRVKVFLDGPSFVRVLSGGQQVFQGQLPAGEQTLSFAGFAQGFVDVEVRGVDGKTTTQRVEVLRGDNPDSGAALRAKSDTSLWYADVGTVVSALPQSQHNLHKTDVQQASLAYSYLAKNHAGRWALQSVNEHVRVTLALADLDRAWDVSALAGMRGEKGFNASANVALGRWRTSAGLTEYRPPMQGANVAQACYAGQEGFCFSNDKSGYSSRFLSTNVEGIPVRLNMNWRRSAEKWLRQTNLASSISLRSFGPGASLELSLLHSSQSPGVHVYASLMIPLERASGATGLIHTSLSGRANERPSYSLSYSESLPRDSESLQLISSYSVSTQASLGGSDAQSKPSMHASVQSQWGVVKNSTQLSYSAQGGAVINAAFSSSYGASKEGFAFNSPDAPHPGGAGSLSSSGFAGVVVYNRSLEQQSVVVHGQETVVPAQSNVLIALATGYLDDVRVTPGPVQNLSGVEDGQMLYKGNLKSVVIPEGFWVLARFKNADGAANSAPILRPEYTFKRPGSALERLYLSANGEASLFEFKENGHDIVRYITVPDGAQQYRCVTPASAMPEPGASSSYAQMDYACTALPAGLNRANMDHKDERKAAAPSLQSQAGARAN